MSRRRNNEKEPLTPEQLAAARAAQAAWAREYRRKYPERNREAIARYWARKAAQGSGSQNQA